MLTDPALDPLSSWTQVRRIKPLPPKLVCLNFHPPEVVSRYRDPQLQVDENYS